MMQTIFVSDICTHMWSDEADYFHTSYLYPFVECCPLLVCMVLWSAEWLNKIKFIRKSYIANLLLFLLCLTMSKMQPISLISISSWQYLVEYYLAMMLYKCPKSWLRSSR